jgi:hypothetical protein
VRLSTDTRLPAVEVVAWRAKQNLDDRLPARFADVLEPVLAFTDGISDITRVPEQGRWSPNTRDWR